jgi:hypothetical protein
MKKIDLLFVLDVTGSMGGLIEDAQRRMRDMLQRLTDQYDLDLKVGLSLYRDHPSQENSFVTVIFDLVEVDKIKSIIDQVSVGGGGDAPEAVIDGLIDGAEAMSWRDGSRRIAFLLGDAAPHGMVWKEPCCQCGRTWGDAVATMQLKRVTLYAVAIGGLSGTKDAFKTLATFTGGMLLPESGGALNAVLQTLNEEFEEMDLGTKVLELLSKETSPEDICQMLNINRAKLSELETRAHTVST